MNIQFPQKHGFTVYSKSNCSYCNYLEILLEDYYNENEENITNNTTKINCDKYLINEENKNQFIEFIKNVGKIDDVKTFPIVFYDGKFIGGFKETEEYIKCNMMKFDAEF